MDTSKFRLLTKIIDKGKYSFLFISLLALLFVTPVLIHYPYGSWFVGFLLTLALIAIVFTALENKFHFSLACLLALLILIFYFIYHFSGNELARSISTMFSMIFYIFAIAVIFREVLTTRKITADIILGSISIYFLLALVYANAFELIEIYSPGSFSYETAKGFVKTDPFNLLYFSFTTLTTVGFGEIVPVTHLAKTIVIFEEISGVLYLAAIVSRLIAGFTSQKQD